MPKDYLLDRHRRCVRLDVHDEPVQERLRVRLITPRGQPIDHASSFRRCLDEVPNSHTEKRETGHLLVGNYPHTSNKLVWTGLGSHHP